MSRQCRRTLTYVIGLICTLQRIYEVINNRLHFLQYIIQSGNLSCNLVLVSDSSLTVSCFFKRHYHASGKHGRCRWNKNRGLAASVYHVGKLHNPARIPGLKISQSRIPGLKYGPGIAIPAHEAIEK